MSSVQLLICNSYKNLKIKILKQILRRNKKTKGSSNEVGVVKEYLKLNLN